MAVTRRVFLALGSNLGDRRSYLKQAISRLPDIVAMSQVYETEPVGGPLNQGRYLNMVVELSTERDAHQLLDDAHDAERSAGRERSIVNGPRTLDVDILLFGDERIDELDLQVPHPRMWERRFVLQPLSELAPELLPEGWQERVVGDVQPVGSL